METYKNNNEVQMSSLNIGGEMPRKKYPVVDDGVYEAEFKEFRVAMEDTPWGIKQAARLRFSIVAGPFANSLVTFKSNFYQVEETKQWIIPSKSKLADAIRVVTKGVGNLGQQFVGTRVLVNVKTGISKKTGEKYSIIDKIMPMPVSYTPSPMPIQQPQPAPQQPMQYQVPPVSAQPQMAPQPQQRMAAPAPAPQPQKSQSDLLSDLTEFSDYEL